MRDSLSASPTRAYVERMRFEGSIPDEDVDAVCKAFMFRQRRVRQVIGGHNRQHVLWRAEGVKRAPRFLEKPKLPAARPD